MSPPEQLARIQVELEEAHRRAHEIVAPLKNEGWGARAAPDQWSVAECLIHLRELFRGTPYRMDFVGRLLWWAATLRLPIKTTEPFVPARGQPKDPVLSEFDALQSQMIGCLETDPGSSATAPEAGSKGRPQGAKHKGRLSTG